MPKSINLTELNKVLTPASAANKAYFLFMLGTDTKYTPLPTKVLSQPTTPTDYDNGETLSFMAQLITQKLRERPAIEGTSSLAFSAPSVDLVNGPTTRGTEVGERIALGVFLVLQALAEGKETIFITGHSRGAVESLLIIHELERIKQEIRANPSKTLHQILLSTPCKHTNAAFNKPPFTEINEAIGVRTALAARLEKAAIYSFLLDPVPGGSILMLGEMVAWRDSRFYNKPPCTGIEVLISRDERTRCFKAIVPQEVTPNILPGNHGTFSGNLYTQTKVKVPQDKYCGDTSLVQKLVIVKMLHFYNSKTDNLLDRNPAPVSLGHPLLEVITNDYFGIRNQPGARNRMLLRLYDEILISDPAYQFLATHTYAGSKDDFLGSWGIEKHSDGSRLIHFGNSANTSLRSITPMVGKNHVNLEHVKLQTHAIIAVSPTENALNQLIQLNDSLRTLFSGYNSGDKPSRERLEASDARNDTFDVCSYYLDAIGKQFIQTHMPLEARDNLLQEIEGTFKLFSGFSGDVQPIVTEYMKKFKEKIKDTAEAYSDSLIAQYKMLSNRIHLSLAPDESFHITVNSLIERTLKSAKKETGTVKEILESIIGLLNRIKDNAMVPMREFFEQQLKNLMPTDSVENQKAAIIFSELMNGPFPNMEDFFALQNADYFTELERLFLNINRLIRAKKVLQRHIGSEPLRIETQIHEMHLMGLVDLAVKFQTKNELAPLDFRKRVEAHAIALGQPDPRIRELNEQLAKKDDALNRLRSEQENNASKAKEHTDRITNLNATNEQQITQIQKLEEDIKSLKEQIGKHNSQNEREKQNVSSLWAQINSQKDELERQKGKIEAQEKELSVSKGQLSLLITQKIDLESQVKQLNQNNEEQTQQIQRISGQEKQVQEQLSRSETSLKALKARNNELEESINTLKKERMELTQRNKQQKEQIVTLTTKQDEQRTQQEDSLTKLNIRNNTLEQQISQLSAQQETLTEQNNNLSERIASQSKQITTLAAAKEQQAQDMVQLQQANKIASDKIEENNSKHLAINSRLKQEIADLTKTKKDQNAQIDELTAQKTRQAQEIEGLKKENEVQKGIITQLNAKNEADTKSAIDQLMSRVKEKDTQITQLQVQKTEQAQRISELVSKDKEQEETIEKLTFSQKEQGQTIVDLNQQKATQEQHISTLSQQIDAQRKELSELSILREQISKLKAQKVEQEQRINQFVARDKEQGQRIEELSANEAQQRVAIEQLNAKQSQQEKTIDELNKQKATQEQLIKQLTIRGAQQEHSITGLNKDKIDQGRRIDQSNSKENQQEKTIADLNQQKATQEQLIRQLTIRGAELEQAIASHEQQMKQLTMKEREQEQAIAALNHHKEAQAQQIERLNTKGNAQEQTIADLNHHKEAQAQQIQQLNIKGNEQEQTIADLNKDKETQARQIEQLNREKSEQNRTIEELEAQKKEWDDLNIRLNTRNNQSAELQKQLQTAKEITCAHLIENKLIPANKEYLLHLVREAQKINAAMDKSFSFELNKSLPQFDKEHRQYQMLAHKYSIAQGLLTNLTDTKTNPLPSARVTQFALSIRGKDMELGQHRDEAWKRFIHNTLVAIAVICSGIIPGILAIAAYSVYTNKTSPLFFTQSKGACFVKEASEVIGDFSEDYSSKAETLGF